MYMLDHVQCLGALFFQCVCIACLCTIRKANLQKYQISRTEWEKSMTLLPQDFKYGNKAYHKLQDTEHTEITINIENIQISFPRNSKTLSFLLNI